MGGKYKKRLRNEKSKVKLRRKTLPKGQNITDTSFKVKKIITVEQLKKVDENEPVSSWNISLKDLLIHLNHHNKSSRINGLNGIKEVITNFPDVLQGASLRNIVLKVLELVSDVESKIRTIAITLLNFIFKKLKKCQMVPFHDILNVHLLCVMTHRQTTIQKDALKLADVIVDNAPLAIKQNSKIIIRNFIRILSNYECGFHSELHFTRGSKKDLIESRISILQRLHKILCICFPKEQCKEENVSVTVNCNEVNEFSLRTITNKYKRVPNLSIICKPRMHDLPFFEDDEKDCEYLASQLLPILLEIWAEFSPSNYHTIEFINESILKDDSAKLLNVILQIILILSERILMVCSREKVNQFKLSYGEKFVKYFLSAFPYLPQALGENSKDSSNAEDSEVCGSFLMQNLNLCHIAFQMKIKLPNDLENKMYDFIHDALLVRNIKCEEILGKIIEGLVLTQPRQKNIDFILKAGINAYKRTSNTEFQKKFLDVITKLSVNDSYKDHCNLGINEWLVYLANGLCKSKISFNAVEVLNNVASKRIASDALKELEKNFYKILGNIPVAEIDSCDPYEGKKLIANILYWCDSNIIVEALQSGILENSEYSADIKSYLIKIFNYKLQMKKVVDKIGMNESLQMVI